MDPNCPWKNTTDKRGPWYTPDPQCDRHFNPTPNVPLEWGVNTGVCNVPTWGEQAMIDEANDPNGVIVLRDNARDDFNSTLTFGRYIVLKHR